MIKCNSIQKGMCSYLIHTKPLPKLKLKCYGRQLRHLNSLAPPFFKIILRIDILSISSGIHLRWLPQNPTDDKSTLFEVINSLRPSDAYMRQ